MKLLKIADLCESVNVGFVGPSTRERDVEGVPFLMGKNIGPGYLKLKSLDRVRKDFHLKNRKSQLKAGDIVVVRIGNSGQAVQIPEEFGEANCAGLIIIKKPNSLINPNYLVYYLNSPQGRAYSLSKATGTTRQTLNTKTVAETLVPIPSVEKQNEIVEILDNAFAEIEKIRLNIFEQLDANLSLLSHALRNLINDPDVECRNTTLDHICENLDNKRIPITRDVRASGEYPYYGASGVIDYVEDYIFEGDALLVSEDGANLLARSTPIAFSVSGKYWVNNHAHILKFVDQELQKYVEYLLENTKLDDFITGAAQPKLTQRALNTIPIRIPVQEGDIKEVVAVISSLKELSSSVSDNLKLRLKLTDELQASLLGKNFTIEEAVA